MHTENIVIKNNPIEFTMAQKKSDIILNRHIVRFDFTTPVVIIQSSMQLLIEAK